MNKGRLLHILSVTTVALALTFAISCSDSATDSTPKAVGDHNDAEFAAISEQLNSAALDFDALDWGNVAWDSIPGMSPMVNSTGNEVLRRSAGGTLLSYSLTIDSATFWHIFLMTVANLGDTATVIDSIRFSGMNGPALPADLGDFVTSTDIHVHVQASINQDSSFSGSISAHSIFVLTMLGVGDSAGGDTISFSGISADTVIATVSDTSSTCQFTVASTKTLSNVVTIDDQSHPCPVDGSISASINVDVLCSFVTDTGTDSLSINGAWTVAASFNSDGSASMVFENADTRWTGTEVCEGGVQASGLVGISIRPGGGN